MNLFKLCVVDTNVGKTANLESTPDLDFDVSDECILRCIEVIEEVIKNKGVVVDENGEILEEYFHQLSLKGQPGVGDKFAKWVCDHIWSLPDDHRVSITKKKESYQEFPSHQGLKNFDRSDRKFVAVSYAHPRKPPIIQATDSKWWGWKDALQECEVEVYFPCEEYIKAKYEKKMGFKSKM